MKLTRYSQSSVAVLVYIVAAFSAASASAKTVYVSTTGNDANNGVTWATAKRTVQAGLNTAVSGDQVWVAAGTYVENITLKLDVALYGGFAGNETDRAERNWTTNKTILDGNQAGSVVTSPSSATETTRIDGFTLRNGAGTVLASTRYGGGIYCSFSSPTITNNTITNNSVLGRQASGGGIYCYSSSPTIAHNTITDNTVSGYETSGGGIYCTGGAPTVAHNAISRNNAFFGSGVYCYSSAATIAHNAINRNGALGSSGGGGGVYCGGPSSPSIVRNTITANSASWGAGISCSFYSSPIIANNMIAANAASSNGGGVYCGYSSSPMIANDTIVANNAVAAGGIYCEGNTATIVSTIVAFNTSGIYGTAGVLTLRHVCVYANRTYNYSNMPDPTGSNGNISADPRLVGLSYGSIHIHPDSPCVDAGDDGVVQPGWLDTDGQSRIIGLHVDIGADEADGTLWPEGPYVIIRVGPNGDDANDGFSWSLAKRTVQAGIEATAMVGGEVWVRAGTYYERIELHPFVHVYGGFAGIESTRDSRDWVANITILDGHQDGSVVAVCAGERVSTIDGFTIRNGSGTLSSEPYRDGGGVYCSHASPTIANNTISGNSASYNGGGICCYYSSPTIANNTIAGNIASRCGGGILSTGGFPNITNNVISGNTALLKGGGIACSGGPPTIANNTIIGNSAPDGGGIHCNTSSPTIANNTIGGNTASTDGGGIYCDMSSSPAIMNNRLMQNTALTRGGGIYCYYSSPTILSNSISGNRAHGASAQGGAIYCYSYSSPKIAGNTISGNTATSSGGGIGCYYYASPTIVNSTITGNSAADGGAIHSRDSSPTVTNAVMVLNSSGICKTGSGTLAPRYNCVFGNTAYSYSGITDPTGTNGNISFDPLFVRPASPGPDGEWGTPDDDYGDLRLRGGSPCIDAGDNAAVPADAPDLDGDGDTTEPLPLDLGGWPRFIDDLLTADTGLGTPPIVDMGAYEYFDAVGPTLVSTVSRKTHGTRGDFDVNLMPAGTVTPAVECRKDGPTKLVLTFSEDVVAVDGTADGTEVGLSGGTLGAVTIVGRELTVNLSGVLDMTCLTITLSGIADLAGNPLTGENTVHIRVLLGDTNGSGAVSVADVNQTRSRSGQMANATNFRSDTNCTGAISVADVNQVRSRSGNACVCP